MKAPPEGHWDEVTFLAELMTGFSGATNFTSAMTVAALENMEYETISNFSIPTATMPQLGGFMLA